jgi:predicted CopG family antitoxin
MATNAAAALNTTGLSAREAAMLEDTDVLGHIRSVNERINRDAIAEGWEFWTTVSEDIAGEYANVYEYEHSGAADSVSDFHKELYGRRPSGMNYSSMRLEELEAIIKELAEEAKREAEYDYPEYEPVVEVDWSEVNAQHLRDLEEDRLWDIQDSLNGVR